MRTIKFRGKEIRTNQWVYGDFRMPPKKYPMITIWEESRLIPHCIEFLVLPESVGQFTGLHDKNGKEIYEGDIVNLVNYGERGDALVLWNQDLGAWCLQLRYEPRVGSKTLGSWQEEEVLEVIGNIHDNPELLKGGEE